MWWLTGSFVEVNIDAKFFQCLFSRWFFFIFVAIHQLFEITGLYSKLMLKKDFTGRCHVNKKLLNWGMFSNGIKTDSTATSPVKIIGNSDRILGSGELFAAKPTIFVLCTASGFLKIIFRFQGYVRLLIHNLWVINYESSSCSLLARTDPPWCEIIGPDVPVFNETALLKIKDDIFKRLAPQIQINSYIYLRHVTTVNMLYYC